MTHEDKNDGAIIHFSISASQSSRCGRSDYSVVNTSLTCYPASNPSIFKLSHSLQSLHATLSVSMSNV
jgi:hypothetical protein